VRVARYAQVVRAPDVHAGLEAVIAAQLRDVADQLPLRLVLIQRTVAAVDAQPGSEIEAGRPLDESGRQPRTERLVGVEAGNAGGGGGGGAEVERQDVDLVFEPAESKIREERR
jgi:hypothetical protein